MLNSNTAQAAKLSLTSVNSAFLLPSEIISSTGHISSDKNGLSDNEVFSAMEEEEEEEEEDEEDLKLVEVESEDEFMEEGDVTEDYTVLEVESKGDLEGQEVGEETVASAFNAQDGILPKTGFKNAEQETNTISLKVVSLLIFLVLL